jgi:hypothetical protein
VALSILLHVSRPPLFAFNTHGSYSAAKCLSAALSAVELCLQTATIRILIGMAMTALQNFSTGLEADLALLNGSSSSSSSEAGQDSQQQQQQQQQQELTPEMRTALVFRSQRKQLLLDVISVLAEKLKQVQYAAMRTVVCCNRVVLWQHIAA